MTASGDGTYEGDGTRDDEAGHQVVDAARRFLLEVDGHHGQYGLIYDFLR